MATNENGRPPEQRTGRANSLLHPQPSIEAAMDTWRWLHSWGLGSELVWHVAFEPFGLCHCVRCPNYIHGDGQ